MKPYNVVKDFEQAVAEYTGAPYCVTTNSCTSALMLAVAWHLRNEELESINPDFYETKDHTVIYGYRPHIEIPKRTYISVPMSIIHAGGRPTFSDDDWLGAYQLKPLPVWDSARYFTEGLYRGEMPFSFTGRTNYHELNQATIKRDCAGSMVCVSFHASKTLGDTQGGAILHDNPAADAWLRRARFDGRTEGVAPKDDIIDMVGHHCYMSPDVAARLLLKLSVLPKHNEPLPNDNYADLSTMEIFK